MVRGFTRVRPLLGGFDAWVEAGFSVERLPPADTAQGDGSTAYIDNLR
jgi:3-mercaptopyruvate sulfurtransferase SseA